MTVYLSSASLSHNSSFRNKIGPNLTFLCVCYRSLYLLSSLSLVRLCDVLFLVTANIITLCRSKSLRLQCYKTHIFQNAFIFSSKLATRISQGLNVTHLSNVVLCKIFLISQDKYLLNEPVGIGLIFNGRIKGAISVFWILVLKWVQLFSSWTFMCHWALIRSYWKDTII